MKEILSISLALSLTVQFIYACFWEGMIFGRVAGWLSAERLTRHNRKLKPRVPLWIQKPLFACPICMTPYYSALILFLMNYTGLYSALLSIEIMIIFVASGLSTIFSRLYD